MKRTERQAATKAANEAKALAAAAKRARAAKQAEQAQQRAAALQQREQEHGRLRRYDSTGRPVPRSRGENLHAELTQHRGAAMTRVADLLSFHQGSLWPQELDAGAQQPKYIPRQPRDWNPHGRSLDTTLRAWIIWNLQHYPVPEFLLAAFNLADDWAWAHTAKLFLLLTNGGSLYRAVQNGLIPFYLNRKACAEFLKITGQVNPVQALRLAQVRAAGGDRRIELGVLRSRLVTHTDRHQLQLEAETAPSFWYQFIAWLAAAPLFDATTIPQLVDYINHQWCADPGYTLKGRTINSVTQAMLAWHDELKKGKLSKADFATCGIPNWENVEGTGKEAVRWSMQEILSTTALAKEGKAMHHCVVSYQDSIIAKRCSIWSLRCNDERALTVEVANAELRVNQACGVCNCKPTAKEALALRRWATASGLKISASVL